MTDTAIILLNGQYGVEVGTQNHFRYTEKLNKPVIFLVNQLDNEKCDYDNILEQLKEAYGSKVVPIQYPIATGPGFNALIDVLLMKKYSWKPEGGARRAQVCIGCDNHRCRIPSCFHRDTRDATKRGLRVRTGD